MIVVDRLSLRPNPPSAFVLCAGSFDQCNKLGTASSDLNLELGDKSLDLNSLGGNGRSNFFQRWEGTATASWSSRSRTIWSARGWGAWRAVLELEFGSAARSVGVATTATATS